MCGRYATTRSADDLARLFAAFDETEGGLAPDYNLAPTDPAPIVRVSQTRAARVLSVARWGLVPVWADNPKLGARMINARSETVATAKAYAPSFKGKRCLVPADGWFEWANIDGRKVAHFMTVPEGFAFAGLWAAGRFGLSCTIITTAAVGELTRIHDRMPLLLDVDRWDDWLTAPASEELLLPPALDYVATIEVRPVGPAVGNVRNDGPELIARIGGPEVQESLF